MKHFLIKKKGSWKLLATFGSTLRRVREDNRHIITSTQTKTGALVGAGMFMEKSRCKDCLKNHSCHNNKTIFMCIMKKDYLLIE